MLTYVITEDDFSNPPYAKIIQSIYEGKNSIKIRKEVQKRLELYINKFYNAELDLEELNQNILADIEELKDKYPESFVEEGNLGYYSRQVLAELYLTGRCVIDEVSSADLIRQKQQKIQELREQREEKRRIEEENKYKKEKQAEEARVPVQKGMRFKHKHGLYLAYKDVLPSRCTINTFKTYIQEFAEIKYVQGHWLIVKVLKEGGRAWEGTTSL